MSSAYLNALHEEGTRDDLLRECSRLYGELQIAQHQFATAHQLAAAQQAALRKAAGVAREYGRKVGNVEAVTMGHCIAEDILALIDKPTAPEEEAPCR